MGIDETKGGTICCQLGSGGSCEDWQWVTSKSLSKSTFIHQVNKPYYICSIKGSIFATSWDHTE